LGLKGDQFGAAPKLAPLDVEHVITECKEHLSLPNSRRPKNLNK
jgi:hypothetical protein